MLAAILMFCGYVTSNAQEEEEPVVNAYFTTSDMPDMMKFLPGPPDSTSVAFMNDVARYYWGKEMRKNPERADEAKRDAVYGLPTILTASEKSSLTGDTSATTSSKCSSLTTFISSPKSRRT